MKLIKTQELLTLLEIVDDYQQFNIDLKALFNQDYKYSWLVSREALEGKREYIPQIFKNFINEHKNTIDILKRNGMIDLFIPSTPDNYSNIERNQKAYLNYVVVNTHNRNRIYDFVKKLTEIGIEELELCLDNKYSSQVYSVNNENEINYVENMEVELRREEIRTYSKDTAYIITSTKIPNGYKNTIKVNSLVIKPERLPNFYITYETIKEEITNKFNELQKQYPYFIPLIELNEVITNLKNEFDKLRELTEEKEVFANDTNLEQIVDELENKINALEEYKNYIEKAINRFNEENKVKIRKND